MNFMKNGLLIKNVRLYDSDENIVDIAISRGNITKIGRIDNVGEFGQVIDADGRLISPGFIDLHIQGAGGADILDGNEESILKISSVLVRFGVTGILATTVIKPESRNNHIKVAARYVGQDTKGTRILGIHLEGPFINPNRRGGISPESILPPSKDTLYDILEIADGKLRIMTIAPEIEGNISIIKELIKNNIIPSFGHSDANYDETKKGIDAGIRHVTHIFNAMPSVHHREPGPIPAIFGSGDVSVQIISDGVHLHPAIVNMIYRAIGIERCICITDGVQATGLPEGKYIYNGREYESIGGVARYYDGTLIGTSLPVGEIAIRFKQFTSSTLKEAIDTITKNPAKLLGIYDRKGSIDVGKDADLVILDNDYSAWLTIIEGEIAFMKSDVKYI